VKLSSLFSSPFTGLNHYQVSGVSAAAGLKSLPAFDILRFDIRYSAVFRSRLQRDSLFNTDYAAPESRTPEPVNS